MEDFCQETPPGLATSQGGGTRRRPSPGADHLEFTVGGDAFFFFFFSTSEATHLIPVILRWTLCHTFLRIKCLDGLSVVCECSM